MRGRVGIGAAVLAAGLLGGTAPAGAIGDPNELPGRGLATAIAGISDPEDMPPGIRTALSNVGRGIGDPDLRPGFGNTTACSTGHIGDPDLCLIG
jgi:hypothetical protein